MKQPARASTRPRLGCLLTGLVAAIAPKMAAAEGRLPPSPPPALVAPAPTMPPPMESRRPIEAEVGLRLGARAQDPLHPDKLNDLAMDGRLDVQLSGSLNPYLKWQAGFIGTMGRVVQGGQTGPARSERGSNALDIEGRAALLDLIGRLELHQAFNLWVGRMLVPTDRAGLSSEWFIAPWLFPGRFALAAAPAGPRQGRYGRSDGATAWGDLWGGVLKYHLGIHNLADPKLAPLYSGRLSLSLLDPEPGYRSASTYYGSKDVLTLGVALQYQADGSIHVVRGENQAEVTDAWDDFTGLSVDLLFEKNLGGAGVLDVEGALHKDWGRYEPYAWFGYALVSYLLPIEVGWGRFQPLFRLQRAARRGQGDDTLADAQLGYIIDGSRARVIAGYQYSKVSSQRGNALLFGLQLMSR